MEGLTILYETEAVVGYGFNWLAFWIVLGALVVLSFGISIPSFIHETATLKEGLIWGFVCGLICSLFAAVISMLVATLSDQLQETRYACTIDYSKIDQEEFETTYEIVEQKGTMYVIRLRDND